jgi:SAM-dependent methyltransferase
VSTAGSGTWKPGTKVLDLGCGAGTNSLFLARQGFHVTGIDLGEGAVRAATERARRAGVAAEFRVGDVTKLPFAEGAFGGAIDVGCFHTLPLDLRPAYAKEVARILRPRRVLALSWIAREFKGDRGPPHRPSVEEVAHALEEEFLFLRAEYWPSYTGRPQKDAPPVYVAWLGRRSFPRPRAR